MLTACGPAGCRPRRGRRGLPALGRRGRELPEPRQQRLARALADAGADVIVGSHAHVQQGAGWLGDTYVDYGLGNFLWYHNHQPDTGVLRLRVEDGHVGVRCWVPAEIQRVRSARCPLHGKAGPTRSPGGGSCAAALGWPPDRSSAPPVAAIAWRPAGVARVRAPDRAGAAGAPELHPRARVPGRLGGPALPAAALRRLRRARPHREHGRARRVRAGRRSASSPGCTTHAGRSGGCDPSATSPGTTTGRWRPTTPRRTTAAGSPGATSWSDHAYGAAIDINPVENPYLRDGVRPTAGRPALRAARPGSRGARARRDHPGR